MIYTLIQIISTDRDDIYAYDRVFMSQASVMELN